MCASTGAASFRRRRLLLASTMPRPRSCAPAAQAESRPLQPGEAVGMSKEEILATFYGTIIFRRGAQGWMTPFKEENFKGKLTSDLLDAAHRRGRCWRRASG